ncbi:TetR/AcrR family transcriptional regulator [Siminovitchia fortis]|uniref:TetR/AcrR family transcriptional regulator n=1 Tax=Siminovitchia fortis TaxID=254758 RepID=UPI0011A35DB5|nr:TetR/AcrR family transcriptional regulator [Siminovitchia fortis]
MNKKQHMSEHTKALIASKAAELFSQKGYKATTMDDICVATGMSKGSVYYHFKSKEVLFLYLLEGNQQEQQEKWEQAIANVSSARQKLYLLAEQYAEMVQAPLAIEEFLGTQQNSQVYEKLSALRRSGIPTIEKIVEEGMENGEFLKDDPVQLANIIGGILDGLDLSADGLSLEQRKAIYRKGVTIILKGIENA